MTVTVGKVEVIATPPIVPVIVVAVPETTPVKVAEYVPFVLSVVPLTVPVEVPPVREKTTVDPPVDKLFPAASRACKVMLMEFPEETVADDKLINEVAVEIVPGVTVIVGSVVVTAVPPMVAPMVVAVPASTPVNVAV